ncbi:MAG: DNA polymerase III subunit gamma/tau, partial [Clostridia bacterium]|nr:DNA polymerase III subunit gamma/tau [Clostridia bacterium]
MYQALYRKWRPSTFAEVSGQPQVTLTLLNELKSGRVSHAYLFTGSRGTGKTSCAKILAKAVNCENPADGEPCCACEMCRSAENGDAPDIIEIDAASNNGVDNIRDIREEVNLSPFRGKYRVYIIDEVHMLSQGAFNALLKTLEEPPAHVIFILATTEVHKLPATVLSRCQRFDFKRISPENISDRLKVIAEGEGFKITDDAAALIARLADGGMRDAVSLLDRCCARGTDIDTSTVSAAAGIAGTMHLFKMSEYIASADTSACLTLVNTLHKEACDIESLCSELTYHFRNLMIAKTVGDCSSLITAAPDEIKELKTRAGEFKLSKILSCLDILEETLGNMKGAPNKKIILESAVIRMCAGSNRAADSGEDVS